MEYKIGLFPYDSINIEDTLLKISTGEVSAAMVESVKRFGLLNPPAIIASSQGYRIVSGFKRIAACRLANVSPIAARILDPSTPLERCIQIAILDNTSQRPLNQVEQANAVALLSSVYYDSSQLVAAANLAGLPINPDMAAKLQKLSRVTSTLKSGVLEGTIALPVALHLHDLDDAGRRALTDLLRELGLSLNRQRELIEWVVSICRRDDTAPSSLLTADEIVKYRRNKELDRRQKGALIREYLKKRRYPTIVRHEQRFADIVNRLKLSRGTNLIAPQHFESPTYAFKMEFKSQQELASNLKKIEEIVKSETLQELWLDVTI